MQIDARGSKIISGRAIDASVNITNLFNQNILR